jgi:alpha,alpha-trehalase
MRLSHLGPQFTPLQTAPAIGYIDSYWKRLERFHPKDEGTLVGVPRPYFVPSVTNDSGFAFEELYYWDTYFMARGIIGTSKEHLVKGMADNLISLMERYHVIPNAGRTYFTSRSQPPFLTSLIMEVYALEGDKRWMERAMDVAKDEYRTVWMGTTQPNWRQVFNGLSRYYDINVLDDLAEAESGWDMTTRFNRQCLSYIPVDLNALLYKYEMDFASSARVLGETEEADEWKKRAALRKAMMMKYLWNEEKGFYFDYNFMTGRQSEIWSLAGYYPMWAGMDDPDRAARVYGQLERFEAQGGLTTTAKQRLPYSTFPTQWAYPNGWAPLQLIVTEGLERYGYHTTAERLARKWLRSNLTKFEQGGQFYEKYNVIEPAGEPSPGVYPSQVGFGWTNGVFTHFVKQYLRPEEYPVLARPSAMRFRVSGWPTKPHIPMPRLKMMRRHI